MVRTMRELSPIESEFSTTQEAEAHDRWFRGKVTASLEDPRPSVEHAVVMDEMQAIVRTARRIRSPRR